MTGESNGEDANDTFVVTVVAIDDAPVPANEIEDVEVNEDAPDQVVALGNVFNDVDDANASITKAAVSSDSSLVTAPVSGDTLP